MHTQNLIEKSFIPYSFNGMEKDDEMKGEGDSYNTYYRQLDSKIGRWLSIDPRSSSFSYLSPYCQSNNNPVVFNDPKGDAPVPHDNEKAKEIVNQFGLLIKDVYNYYNSSPQLKYVTEISMNYFILPPLKASAQMITETNPNKATWVDLSMMYMFEFGGVRKKGGTYNLKVTDINSPTIRELRVHGGVVEARKLAVEAASKLKRGQKTEVSSTWQYGFNEMEANLTGDWANLEVFLGTYNTTVTINKNLRGVITYTYTVKNESHLESLSRFIRNVEGDNEAAIPDKKRGEGINIGGDFSQTFTWSVTVKPKKFMSKKRYKF